MGSIFGKITVETPKFQTTHSTPDYDIRTYAPSVIAEITYNPGELGGADAGFPILAGYIGVAGDPQNSPPEKIAMTAPVITAAGGGGPESPVTMGFVLPAKYARAGDAPRPTDGRVRVREEGERRYGVVRFGGAAANAGEKAEGLRRSLERDGYVVVGDYVLGRYNPPWTLPSFRTNEVMFLVK